MNWIEKLAQSLDGNCLWCGDDFTEALRQAKKWGANVYEHDEHRGEFVVNRDKSFTHYPEHYSQY